MHASESIAAVERELPEVAVPTFPRLDLILDAIFGDRQDVLARLARAGDPASRARIEKALQAYDYVYDVPPERRTSNRT